MTEEESITKDTMTAANFVNELVGKVETIMNERKRLQKLKEAYEML
jgi:hypothetical protein